MGVRGVGADAGPAWTDGQIAKCRDVELRKRWGWGRGPEGEHGSKEEDASSSFLMRRGSGQGELRFIAHLSCVRHQILNQY